MRAIGFLTVLAVVGAVVWLAVGGRLASIASPVPTTELGLAEAAAGELRDLDDVVGDALDNARRATALADELDAAAARTRSAAGDLASLADDNDAARPSADAARAAAEDAEEAALLMRRYADALAARFQDVDAVTEEAEAIAGMAVAVEETQAEAEAAAERARAARAAMIRTEEVAEDLDGAPAPTAFPRGDIVILNDAGQGDGGQGDAGAVRERLDDIFPDDVIEYEEDDVPYGERG